MKNNFIIERTAKTFVTALVWKRRSHIYNRSGCIMTQEKPNERGRVSSQPVGVTFRKLRKQQGITIQDLARKSGVSVGMISQIERDLANPSMRVLTAIRRALNISMQAMFDDQPETENEPPFVRRAGNRPFIDLGSLQKELLTSGGHHHLQIMILTVAPDASSGNTALSYPAEKGGMVLDGELVLTVDQREAKLKQGDSFVFDSALEHCFRNESDHPARILWVIGAVQFDRHL